MEYRELTPDQQKALVRQFVMDTEASHFRLALARKATQANLEAAVDVEVQKQLQGELEALDSQLAKVEEAHKVYVAELEALGNQETSDAR